MRCVLFPTLTSKLNSTDETRLGDAYPVIRTSNPPAVRVATTSVIFGAVASMSTVDAGRSAGPLSMFAMSLTVPATVPVSNVSCVGNTAVVLFAGMVKVDVRSPFENCVIGSSTGTSAVDVNVNLRVPLSALGCGVARVNSMLED